MTITEMELDIENIPFMDDDNDEHWICSTCYPGYTPGKIVPAICGALMEDCPEGDNGDENADDCYLCKKGTCKTCVN